MILKNAISTIPFFVLLLLSAEVTSAQVSDPADPVDLPGCWANETTTCKDLFQYIAFETPEIGCGSSTCELQIIWNEDLGEYVAGMGCKSLQVETALDKNWARAVSSLSALTSVEEYGSEEKCLQSHSCGCRGQVAGAPCKVRSGWVGDETGPSARRSRAAGNGCTLGINP